MLIRMLFPILIIHVLGLLGDSCIVLCVNPSWAWLYSRVYLMISNVSVDPCFLGISYISTLKSEHGETFMAFCEPHMVEKAVRQAYKRADLVL